MKTYWICFVMMMGCAPQRTQNAPKYSPQNSMAEATAHWITQWIKVEDQKLIIGGASWEDRQNCRIPLRTHAQLKPNTNIIDQTGLYPVQLNNRTNTMELYVGYPFYDYADVDHSTIPVVYRYPPKASAIHGKGLRNMGLILYKYLTKHTKQQPINHRTKTTMGGRQDSYFWTLNNVTIELRAFTANDNNGLILRIARTPHHPKSAYDPTIKRIFDGWTTPLGKTLNQ